MATVEWAPTGDYQLWDFAGEGGLSLALAVFGDAAGRLSPFQSVTLTEDGATANLLRLCQHNFRVGLQNRENPWLERLAQAQADHSRVWVRPSDLVPLRLADDAWPPLSHLGTARRPHRFEGLGLNRALPARFQGIATLLWRQSWSQGTVIECHLGRPDAARWQALMETAWPDCRSPFPVQ
ncbi:MAG: hypothetical protein IGQ88_10860 [Gloeomargaritaceae cyanobacterium C42_A2020_066]|nr:hypothetical protein [Gloeomargaritaceae cyanobacterium C42_A2020_066]